MYFPEWLVVVKPFRQVTIQESTYILLIIKRLLAKFDLLRRFKYSNIDQIMITHEMHYPLPQSWYLHDHLGYQLLFQLLKGKFLKKVNR